MSHGSAGGRSITSLGWIYRSISGHKILTANQVLSAQQINPSHHLTSAVYVYPKRLAGSFEAGALVVCVSKAISSKIRLGVLLTTFILLSFFLLVLLPDLSTPRERRGTALPPLGPGVEPHCPPLYPQLADWPVHVRGGGPPDSRFPALSSDDGDPAVALTKLPEFS
jgi:hypothetical protein